MKMELTETQNSENRYAIRVFITIIISEILNHLENIFYCVLLFGKCEIQRVVEKFQPQFHKNLPPFPDLHFTQEGIWLLSSEMGS